MSLKRNRTAFTTDDQSGQLSFIFYGTALPPQGSEARDDGSYVPLWKQEVTDERGRKRLHGAFTGGFSAGYFNTVGSKEGWTPATFKSSRATRAQAVLARPEDFMDAEDLAEAAETQKIETNQIFTGFGSTGDELARRAKHITLMDLLTPAVQDMIGVILLKKMGWKEGQGVGPKIKRKTRVSDEGEESVADDEKNSLITPTNPTLVTFNYKPDTKGVGYVWEGSLREQVEESKFGRFSGTKPKQKPVKGGFGVGVLNDDGGDEDEPYEIRPKTAYNRVICGARPTKNTRPIVKKSTKHVFVSKKAIKAKSGVIVRKCHDGRPPLDGFILSPDSIQSQDGWYLPPEVPASWVPSGPGGPQKSKKPDQGNRQAVTVCAESEAAPKLDPRARGSLLGETPLPGKSVFDFMTPAGRDRIVSVTGKKNLPEALGEAPPSTFSSSNPSSLADLVPKLDQAVALEAIRGGFMPYADDPGKKRRYHTFLEVQAGLKKGLPDRKYGMNIQDWIKELDEFVGAARIFKPLTGMIANRFTSATTNASNFQGGAAALTNTDHNVILHQTQPKPEDPAEAAAKMSMYGPITRSLIEFLPARLLCKRFNVKPPSHVGPTGGNDGEGSRSWESACRPPRELVSKVQMIEMMREARGDQGYSFTEGENVVPTVDTERNEALEAEKAGEDVFRAIFGDSDDNDDDE